MRALVVACALSALPASAQVEHFSISLACEGELPALIGITANAPGTIVVSLADMIAACMESLPQRSKWRTGA